MTIILKLQGLDVKAGTEDIRTFFKCLQIPGGGVYIVGGRLREAFIAFTTERDAQLAMRHNGTFLQGSKVKLYISSMEELEHKLEALLKKKTTKPPQSQLTSKRLPSPEQRTPPSNAWPHDDNHGILPPSTALPLDANTANPQASPVQSLDSSTAFLLGVCTLLKELQSSSGNVDALPGVGFPKASNTVVSGELKMPELTLKSKPGFALLFGLPSSATKEDICHFFKGLIVQEAIVNVKLGHSHGCLVMFASMQDACDALHFNKKSLGPVCVEVRKATEDMWTSALQQCEKARIGERVNFPNSPHPNHKQKPTSALQLKRQSDNILAPKAPKQLRPDCGETVEYVVMVKYLSKHMTKTEIKELFQCSNLAHKNVLHLLDKESNRTDTAFLIFNCAEDYNYAINLTGCHVGGKVIEVSSVTMEQMRDMMAKTHPRNIRSLQEKLNEPNKKVGTSDKPLKTCLLVRNMPADVHKNHVKNLFGTFKLKKDNIHLLYDSDGNGLGEAVVQFKTKKLAALALGLHGCKFMGTQVLLTWINTRQMEDILARNGSTAF